jgi:glycosyltransferase involved in cell wall biosynthesis
MINLIAPINTLGYGVAGYNILKELYKIDNSVSLYPISQPQDFEGEELRAAILNQQKCLVNRPCVKIWHQNDLTTRVGNGKYIGFPIFELTRFSAKEVTSLHHCDKIFVCSKWAKDIVQLNTKFKDDDVHVVPLGVDNDIFSPSDVSGRQSTVFLNCGKWEKRKGHDILLECFNDAFSENDDVELWMMCDNPFIGEGNKNWQDLYKNSKLGSKIRIIPRQKTHQDVMNVMRQADCGVFLSRGEGWNLELLEMMAMGKQVIATNYSAHTEFCTPTNSMLVNIDNLETAFDNVFFDGQCGFWAELAQNQKDAAIHYMRDVYRLKQDGHRIINENGIETGKQFSWENSTQELINGL